MEDYDSDLLSLLRLVDSISWPSPTPRRGRPYVYAFPAILKGFIVRIWQRIDSTRGLHENPALRIASLMSLVTKVVLKNSFC